jgi:L-alanine-DL-glutamate epimerase-like enolase superfamily enzyme
MSPPWPDTAATEQARAVPAAPSSREPDFRISAIRHRPVSLRSQIANAYISFAEMDTSLVAVTSSPIRGRRYTGFGFSSNGRYSQGGILERRLIPRLIAASPHLICDDTGKNIDPVRAWRVAMANEKPGGHGERPVAMGALDMALWDLAAKIAGVPLYRLLSDRFGDGSPDSAVFVYAAGGYYRPGAARTELADEMRRYLDLGYTLVKMKIGGAALPSDLDRIETVLDVVGGGDHLAVDANGRVGAQQAKEYGDALAPFRLRWYEEPGDPLDFDLLHGLAQTYPGPLATGENLFSAADARNLLRYGGLRHDQDIIQIDPSLSYGVIEYIAFLSLLHDTGWSPRACIPHGGHQLTLHLASAFHLGGNEAYPGVFRPISGFGDDAQVSDGHVTPCQGPGIGIENNADLYRAFRELTG